MLGQGKGGLRVNNVRTVVDRLCMICLVYQYIL